MNLKAIFQFEPVSRPASTYWLTRFCFQRGLAFIYLIGFLVAARQAVPLIGENGLYPVRFLLREVTFWQAPSLFWIQHSDTALLVAAWAGVFLSALAVWGISDRFHLLFSAAVWACLWLLYLSFVNVGQTFYGFGWESILLEAGFLAIFLGSSRTEAPAWVIWLLRWVVFRIMFGAGLIKLRGDPCWLDLTCMDYHYETQPLPNPLSWYLHKLPALYHKMEVFFTHFVELIVPWLYFLRPPLVWIAGLLTIAFQLNLIVSGNLSWLNYLTIVIAFSCLDDAFLRRLVPVRRPDIPAMGSLRKSVIYGLTGMILMLSIFPVLNMLSPGQRMNASFDPLHLVNTYGAFGSITKTRHEVIIKGTRDKVISPNTEWREYEFKCKPGEVRRRPCIVSPYHYRLDWQMWFAAMSPYLHHPWILNLTAKLLKGDPAVLELMAGNPFPEGPPEYIALDLYEYRFTTFEERKESGNWWKRKYVGAYLPPLSLKNEKFARILRGQGWYS